MKLLEETLMGKILEENLMEARSDRERILKERERTKELCDKPKVNLDKLNENLRTSFSHLGATLRGLGGLGMPTNHALRKDSIYCRGGDVAELSSLLVKWFATLKEEHQNSMIATIKCVVSTVLAELKAKYPDLNLSPTVEDFQCASLEESTRLLE